MVHRRWSLWWHLLIFYICIDEISIILTLFSMGTIASALCTLSPGRKPPAVRGAASPPAPSPQLPAPPGPLGAGGDEAIALQKPEGCGRDARTPPRLPAPERPAGVRRGPPALRVQTGRGDGPLCRRGWGGGPCALLQGCVSQPGAPGGGWAVFTPRTCHTLQATSADGDSQSLPKMLH